MSGLVVLVLRLLLAAGLYLFLGWAVLNLWRDIRQTSQLLASRKIPPIGLSLLPKDGPQRQSYFAREDVTVGRDPACECPVEDETLSARHCRFSYHHGQWWLEDLRSTNGTFLNGERLHMPAVVTTGDILQCGEVKIVISLPGEIAQLPQARPDPADPQDA